MRALALIVMDKIELAQTLVKQITKQLYPAACAQDQSTVIDESSVLEAPVEECRTN